MVNLKIVHNIQEWLLMLPDKDAESVKNQNAQVDNTLPLKVSAMIVDNLLYQIKQVKSASLQLVHQILYLQ